MNDINIENVIIQGLDKIKIPVMTRVRQNISDEPVKDIASAIQHQIAGTDFGNRIKQGDKIAIGVGSRGIDQIKEVVKETVKVIKALGGEAFIVPAMGSHGGANALGQKEVLNSYGITADYVGAPVKSSMDVVDLGKTPCGIPVFFDKHAYNADAIVAINRIKAHTDFTGPIESGLLKMLAIGFGKHKGAAVIHSYGFDKFHQIIPEVGKYILEKAPISLGIALLENGHDHLCKIKALSPLNMEKEEAILLQEEKKLLPRIPFKNLDVLIIDEIGKNISGSSMDTNVVGRIKPVGIEIKYIVVLGLSVETHGNASGIGIADFTTKKVLQELDFNSTYINALTSRVIHTAKLPMILTNDEIAIKTALLLANKGPEAVKMARIKNTLNLIELDISPGLLNEALNNNRIKPIKTNPLIFNRDGEIETKPVLTTCRSSSKEN
jgi:hypothetical protein